MMLTLEQSCSPLDVCVGSANAIGHVANDYLMRSKILLQDSIVDMVRHIVEAKISLPLMASFPLQDTSGCDSYVEVFSCKYGGAKRHTHLTQAAMPPATKGMDKTMYRLHATVTDAAALAG